MDGYVQRYADRSGAPGTELSLTGVTRTSVFPVELRRLADTSEYTDAVELQRITWGASFRDIVPAAVLKICQRIGGVTAGAFDESGRMVGFVYGLTGIYDRRLVHWSHMLAVLPELRDHGIGRRLKEFQRALLIEAGIEWMYWTVDPLVARNAHLNLNRLSASVREYVPNMYGDTGSTLHATGTDRFVLMWPVANALPGGSRGLTDAPVLRNGAAESVVLNELEEETLKTLLAEGTRPCQVSIEIPADVELLAVAEARAWRFSTRRAFMTALASGYGVTGFCRGADERCYYQLSPTANHAAHQS